MKRKMIKMVAMCIVFSLAAVCQAGMVYVDATLANTTIGGDAPVVDTNYATAGGIGVSGF